MLTSTFEIQHEWFTCCLIRELINIHLSSSHTVLPIKFMISFSAHTLTTFPKSYLVSSLSSSHPISSSLCFSAGWFNTKGFLHFNNEILIQALHLRVQWCDYQCRGAEACGGFINASNVSLRVFKVTFLPCCAPPTVDWLERQHRRATEQTDVLFRAVLRPVMLWVFKFSPGGKKKLNWAGLYIKRHPVHAWRLYIFL